MLRTFATTALVASATAVTLHTQNEVSETYCSDLNYFEEEFNALDEASGGRIEYALEPALTEIAKLNPNMAKIIEGFRKCKDPNKVW